MACVTERVGKDYEKKAVSFQNHVLNHPLKTTMDPTNPTYASWISEKMATAAATWKAQALEEIYAASKKGRICGAFFLNPEFEEIANMACRRRMLADQRHGVVGQEEISNEANGPATPTSSVLQSLGTDSDGSSTVVRSGSRSGSRIPIRRK
jgi:hypothetical protein